MEKWEIGPPPSKTPEPIVTCICTGDYVEDPYHYVKFHHDTITPFAPQICESAHQVTRQVFCTSRSLQPRPLHRFSRPIRQMTRFRARMLVLGVRKENFAFRPHFRQKNANFSPIFDGTKFRVKKALTMGCSPVNYP